MPLFVHSALGSSLRVSQGSGINDSHHPQAKWLGLDSVLGSATQVDSGGSSGPETLGRRRPELDLEGPCCQPAALDIITEDEPTYLPSTH